MTALVLQARLDSSRLPGKSLLPLGGRPLVAAVMEALREVPAGVRVLACTEDCLSQFRPLAEKAGFEVFAGAKDDVLGRYCDVIRHFSPSRVIRATGDNPFVFADAAFSVHSEGEEADADYAAYLELPYGAGVESVSPEALLRAERETRDKAEREHVCPYLYNNPALFKIYRPRAPARWRVPSMRITVDTAADYERAQRLERELSRIRNAQERFRGETVIGVYREIFEGVPPPGGKAPREICV